MSASVAVFVVEMRPVPAAKKAPWTELSFWLYRDQAIEAQLIYARNEPHVYGPNGCRRLRVREVSR